MDFYLIRIDRTVSKQAFKEEEEEEKGIQIHSTHTYAQTSSRNHARTRPPHLVQHTS